MENAMQAGVVTADSLRLEARKMRRCSPQLAALGPPASQLRQTYRLAKRACADYEQAARFAAAAARSYEPNAPNAKLMRLLEGEDTAVNRAIALFDRAIYGVPGVPSGN